MAATNKLLILEDAVLIGMAGNPNFVKEFGFLSGLKQISKMKTGCGKCNRSASKRIQLINASKQSIVNMGAEKKRRLKTLLNAEKVRIRFQTGRQIKEHTF